MTRHPALAPVARAYRALRAGDEASAVAALDEAMRHLPRAASPHRAIAYALGEGGPWSDEELAAVGRCSVAEARACRRAVGL